MNIIVADDEMLARETLVGILEDIKADLEIREAGNGQELIELVREKQPDVAFVDIRMPGKSGLEAIKEALPFAPSTQWVLLTGYAEFEYAREAIQLGAVDYLLKPADPELVQNILNQAKAKAGQDCLSHCREFESKMVSIFHNQSEPEQTLPSPAPAGESWLAVIIYEDTAAQAGENCAAQAPVPQILRELINEHCSKELMLALVTLGKKEHIFIGKASTEKERRSLLRLPERIMECTRQQSTAFRLLTWLQTKEHAALAPLREEVALLRSLSFMRCVADSSALLSLSDLELLGANPNYAKTGKIAASLAQAYQDGDYVTFISSCEKLQTQYSSEPFLPPNMEERLVAYLRCNIGPDSSIEQHPDTSWLRQLPQAAGSFLLRRISAEEPGKQDWLDAVIRYLEVNFCGDITVAGIAERFQVSPNHLSTHFHKKMGVTFIQYVTRLRMLKAQELLYRPGMKVNEAAEQVGYYSTRHFTNLFKENVGCYPSEFSKKHPR
ncbi:response regulator [Paenibacillus dokdonensis]|uniref:Response regulator n=1 Tax=Paenibacillus dokdonensis TaxID=2567944 RepID=A0ABU6GN51_9BACL|nr:response regulator [Paenibacillus dokdonensis]MEC0241155.1 response regulator [Paenibacillus dokdonensis]